MLPFLKKVQYLYTHFDFTSKPMKSANKTMISTNKTIKSANMTIFSNHLHDVTHAQNVDACWEKAQESQVVGVHVKTSKHCSSCALILFALT